MQIQKTLKLVSGTAAGVAIVCALGLAGCSKGNEGASAGTQKQLLPQNMPPQMVEAAQKQAAAERAGHQPGATEPAGAVK
jgi:hypothetical protein